MFCLCYVMNVRIQSKTNDLSCLDQNPEHSYEFCLLCGEHVNPKPLLDLKNLQWFDFAGEVAGIYGVIKRLSLLNYPRSKIGNFRQTIASGPVYQIIR